MELTFAIYSKFLVSEHALNLFLLSGQGHYARLFEHFDFFPHKKLYAISHPADTPTVIQQNAQGWLKLDLNENIIAFNQHKKFEIESKKEMIQNKIVSLENLQTEYEALKSARNDALEKRKKIEEEMNLRKREYREIGKSPLYNGKLSEIV